MNVLCRVVLLIPIETFYHLMNQDNYNKYIKKYPFCSFNRKKCLPELIIKELILFAQTLVYSFFLDLFAVVERLPSNDIL